MRRFSERAIASPNQWVTLAVPYSDRDEQPYLAFEFRYRDPGEPLYTRMTIYRGDVFVFATADT